MQKKHLNKEIDLTEISFLETLIEESLTHKHNKNTVKSGDYTVELDYDGYTLKMFFFKNDKQIALWRNNTSQHNLEYFRNQVDDLYFVAQIIYVITKKGCILNDVFLVDDEGELETFNWLDYLFLETKVGDFFDYDTIKILKKNIILVNNNVNYTTDIVELNLNNISMVLYISYEPITESIEESKMLFLIDDEESIDFDFEKIMYLTKTYHKKYKDISIDMIFDEIFSDSLSILTKEYLKDAAVILYLCTMKDISLKREYQHIDDAIDEEAKKYFLDIYTQKVNIVNAIQKNLNKIHS